MLPAAAGSNIFGREKARQVDKKSSRYAFGGEFRHHRERAEEQNYAPRQGQEAFSCKIMKIHRNGLVNGLLDRPSNKNASVLYKKGFARGALNHKCAQVTDENAIFEGLQNGLIRFACYFLCYKN